MSSLGPHDAAQPLVDRILAGLVRRTDPLFVALDGRSGSGKSTLAAAVADSLSVDASGSRIVTVIEGDQFYGGGSVETWDRRSVEERVDRVIDWRRQREVLVALRRRGEAAWQEFDWESPDWDSDERPFAPDVVRCTASAVVILEGAYSARPELADLLDLRVLLDVPAEVRHDRLRRREGEEFRSDWERRWSAAEDLYFGSIVPPANFDLVLREVRRSTEHRPGRSSAAG